MGKGGRGYQGTPSRHLQWGGGAGSRYTTYQSPSRGWVGGGGMGVGGEGDGFQVPSPLQRGRGFQPRTPLHQAGLPGWLDWLASLAGLVGWLVWMAGFFGWLIGSFGWLGRLVGLVLPGMPGWLQVLLPGGERNEGWGWVAPKVTSPAPFAKLQRGGGSVSFENALYMCRENYVRHIYLISAPNNIRWWSNASKIESGENCCPGSVFSPRSFGK